MYLLDTDIVIWILRAHPTLMRFLKSASEEQVIGVSTISVAEVYQHIFPTEVSTAEDFFDHNTIFPVTREIARNGGFYWQYHHKHFAKLTITDCLVAATAKTEDATLYTLNLRHFPMSDIHVRRPPNLRL